MTKRHISDTEDKFLTSDEISLIDLVLILWRGKWIIIVCMLIATITGIFYALKTPEVYSTNTIFVIKTSNKSSSGNLGQLAALAGVSVGSTGNVDPSEYLDKVIQDKDFIGTLFNREWYYHGDSLSLEQIFSIEPDTTISNWEYKYFMKKINTVRNTKTLSLKKDKKSGLLTLTSKAHNPQLAYDLNIFTLDFIRSYIRNSLKSQAKEKRLFIKERIKETMDVLEKSEDALAKFKAGNFMTRSPQILLEEARLSRDVTMNQEIYIQFQKQYELAKIEELDDQTLVQVVKGAEVPVSRSTPKRKLVIMITLIAGVFLGIFIVLIYNAAINFNNDQNV